MRQIRRIEDQAKSTGSFNDTSSEDAMLGIFKPKKETDMKMGSEEPLLLESIHSYQSRADRVDRRLYVLFIF